MPALKSPDDADTGAGKCSGPGFAGDARASDSACKYEKFSTGDLLAGANSLIFSKFVLHRQTTDASPVLHLQVRRFPVKALLLPSAKPLSGAFIIDFAKIHKKIAKAVRSF